MKLITDQELADQFGLESVEKLHTLRARYHWPCVKLGRQEVRFTEAQVEQIVAMHTNAPTETSTKPLLTGQTSRSANRARS